METSANDDMALQEMIDRVKSGKYSKSNSHSNTNNETSFTKVNEDRIINALIGLENQKITSERILKNVLFLFWFAVLSLACSLLLFLLK